jgi:hypothetical protein
VVEVRHDQLPIEIQGDLNRPRPAVVTQLTGRIFSAHAQYHIVSSAAKSGLQHTRCVRPIYTVTMREKGSSCMNSV